MDETAEKLKLANIRNGLAYPHDDVCAFLSGIAHHFRQGYFRIDAMPYRAVIHLLRGGTVTIVDATQHAKRLTDGQKFGVPTWCRVFNRALRRNDVRVCEWETVHMRVAANKQQMRPIVQMVRRLAYLYGDSGPAVIGRNVLLECHSEIGFDDKPELLHALIKQCTDRFP